MADIRGCNGENQSWKYEIYSLETSKSIRQDFREIPSLMKLVMEISQNTNDFEKKKKM